jgi:pterin-4a-carbinolamine dehydratase
VSHVVAASHRLSVKEFAAPEKQVDGWNVIEEHHLAKTFTFPDFREALKFVNRVGELAEEIYLSL